MNKKPRQVLHYLTVIWLTLSFFEILFTYYIIYYLFYMWLLAPFVFHFKHWLHLNEYTSRYLQHNMFVTNVFCPCHEIQRQFSSLCWGVLFCCEFQEGYEFRSLPRCLWPPISFSLVVWHEAESLLGERLITWKGISQFKAANENAIAAVDICRSWMHTSGLLLPNVSCA